MGSRKSGETKALEFRDWQEAICVCFEDQEVAPKAARAKDRQTHCAKICAVVPTSTDPLCQNFGATAFAPK